MSGSPAGELLRRWLRFNAVGLAGMAVQLAVLALLSRMWRGHYLLASGMAVEAAVLHNFMAHMQCTWRERRRRIVPLSAWWRFQVSNGGVSLAGNVLLMRMLVGGAHLPVLAANIIAVGVCGLANFWLGDSWVFRVRGGAADGMRLQDDARV